MPIYYVTAPTGETIRQIAPAWSLDDLYANAARWACGVDIPTAFAQQAVWAKLEASGHKVRVVRIGA